MLYVLKWAPKTFQSRRPQISQGLINRFHLAISSLHLHTRISRRSRWSCQDTDMTLGGRELWRQRFLASRHSAVLRQRQDKLWFSEVSPAPVRPVSLLNQNKQHFLYSHWMCFAQVSQTYPITFPAGTRILSQTRPDAIESIAAGLFIETITHNRFIYWSRSTRWLLVRSPSCKLKKNQHRECCYRLCRRLGRDIDITCLWHERIFWLLLSSSKPSRRVARLAADRDICLVYNIF